MDLHLGVQFGDEVAAYRHQKDVDQGDEEKIYFSPRNYARRLAIIDCETMVYEKYRLWK